jgi:hypothetical protein
MTSDKSRAMNEMAQVVHALMDKHFPGWDKRAGEFSTFQEYSDWVGKCIDSIIIEPDEIRKDQ